MKFSAKTEELNGEIFIRIPYDIKKTLDLKEGEKIVLTLSKK